MREVIELDHRERFQMKLRIRFLQRRKQIGEVTERQFRVQPAGNVKFSRAFIDGLSGDAQRVFDVVRVSVRLTRRAEETAELAVYITDIRRIEMTIDVEVGRAALLVPA